MKLLFFMLFYYGFDIDLNVLYIFNTFNITGSSNTYQMSLLI